MINSREFINKILRYWLTLEALTPQTADKAHPDDKLEPSYEINKEKGAMPWMEGHEHRRKQPRDQHQWHYIVQAGLYDIRIFYEKILYEIKSLIADNEREDDEYDRASGTGRLYDVEVDAEGRPIAETFALSMAGWAAGVILHQGVGALQQGTWCNLDGLPQPGREEIQRRSGVPGFDTLEVALRKELAERVRLLKKPVDKAWFDDFTRLVIRHCSLSEELLGTTPRYIVKSKQLKKVQKNSAFDQLRGRKRDQSLDQLDDQPHDHPHDQPRIASFSEVDHVADARPVDESLINSFYISDLHRIESSSYLGGDAFLSYFKRIMDQDSGERRIDLRSKEGEMEVVRLLHPRYFPQGSWPSDYSLVRSQQFAVNALWNHLTSKRGGLFAVNGPPGTGKTTLLRDIVAAVVVDRAKILSKYDDPRKIFLPKRKYDENEPPYYPIQHLDHAIVVASSNNGAVENVTLELPKTDAVANNFVNQAAYFQELATALLQSAEKQSSEKKKIAISLSKSFWKNVRLCSAPKSVPKPSV